MSRINFPDPICWDGPAPYLGPLLASTTANLGHISIQPSTRTENTVTPMVFYYLNDHLRTSQLIVDDMGNVVWQEEYKPFWEARGAG